MCEEPESRYMCAPVVHQCYGNLPSVVTGIAIAVSGEEGRPLLKFFHSVSVVMMRVTGWIIHLAPVGVCFLVAGQASLPPHQEFCS